MEFLDQIIAFLNGISGSTMAAIAMVIEMVLRLIPTKAPLNILQIVAKVVKTVAVIFQKLADLVDKLIPQNVK